MKRAIAVLLAMLLLAMIPGCAASNGTADETAVESAAPSGDALPADNGGFGVALPSGALPDTDFNAGAQTYERYYDNTTLGLIPSPDYGRIWPYIGGWALAMGMPKEIYGICDANGKIISDPYYNNVELIGRGGAELYVFTKNHVEIIERHEDYDSYYDRYAATLAPLDGSWAETFEDAKWQSWSYELEPQLEGEYASYSYMWRDTVQFDYITARRDGKWGVIGWDGTILLPFQYSEPVCFSEGLAAVLSDDGLAVAFIDITGAAVLGPYDAPGRQHEEYNYSGEEIPLTWGLLFIEGRARYFESGKCGVIDREGNVVVPAQYDFITSFSGGIAMTALRELPDGRRLEYGRYYGLVNDTGKVILENIEKWIVNDGKAAVLRNPDGSTHEAVMYDGTRMGSEYASPYAVGNTFRYGETELLFPEGSEPLVVSDGTLLVSERNDGHWKWRLYDFDGNPLTPERPGRYDGWISMSSINGDLLITMPAADGGYYWPQRYMLYTPDGEELLPDAYYMIKRIDGRFLVRDAHFAGLLDENGEYVIKVPLIAYAAD